MASARQMLFMAVQTSFQEDDCFFLHQRKWRQKQRRSNFVQSHERKVLFSFQWKEWVSLFAVAFSTNGIFILVERIFTSKKNSLEEVLQIDEHEQPRCQTNSLSTCETMHCGTHESWRNELCLHLVINIWSATLWLFSSVYCMAVFKQTCSYRICVRYWMFKVINSLCRNKVAQILIYCRKL